MVFYNREIIALCGYSERTFYRRLKALKDEKSFQKRSGGDLLTLEEAREIADRLGFRKEFEQYIKNNHAS